jgi:hypothetical protein
MAQRNSEAEPEQGLRVERLELEDNLKWNAKASG